MEFDVVIVGAGPAGLAASIRLKQRDPGLEVCVLEKGSEVGAHILSGAVLDPCGLDALLPDWQQRGAPVKVPVRRDSFYLLGEAGQLRIPRWSMPPLMANHGCYLVSMGNVCRWLAEEAEALGVNVFPGMSCTELVWGENRTVCGVVAGEFGLAADGSPGEQYEPGVNVMGQYTLLCEGAHGSLTKQAIRTHDLARTAAPQKYGLGMKEIWEIDPDRHAEGTVIHTAGWPLGHATGGGSFLYHMDRNQVSLGFVVHLDYRNPHLFPYMEFQRFKHHPLVAPLLEGGKRIAYGARAITEGGWQSLPQCAFPGGLLVGCAAGLVNVPRIKGNHNAMLSGIAAAETVTDALASGTRDLVLQAYDDRLRAGPVGRDLARVRNVKPLWSRHGLLPALTLGGLDMWVASLIGRPLFGTLPHTRSDAMATGRADAHPPIDYPRPDGVLSFDRSTNVAFSGTNHEESQPPHLHLLDESVPIGVNLPTYAEPAQRYCPAGVYEVVDTKGGPEFKINFQNCVHCKTCDIKDPSQNIDWRPPQGGDGPNYPNM